MCAFADLDKNSHALVTTFVTFRLTLLIPYKASAANYCRIPTRCLVLHRIILECFLLLASSRTGQLLPGEPSRVLLNSQLLRYCKSLNSSSLI